MADIKRLHYFDHQFLVEADFTDEQQYHLDMRRRHNRVLHTFGVAEGLQVEKTGDTEITVRSGTAVDRDGREMVLDTEYTLNLTDYGPNPNVYVTIAYQEEETDPTTATGVSGNTRVTEKPQIQASTTSPRIDGSVICLCHFRLDRNGNVPGNIGDTFDNGVRQIAGTVIPTGSVGTEELANDSVNTAKIVNGAVTADKITSDVASTGYVDEKTGGTISSSDDLADITVIHSRQINVSSNSTVSGGITQVNASRSSTASGFRSQVNASQDSTASGNTSQVNASYASTTIGAISQVNASQDSTASGNRSQVNASDTSTASGNRSQVNASQDSTASGNTSQVNASYASTASGMYSQVNASEDSTASEDKSQVNASGASTATKERSQVNASQNSTASGNTSQVNASSGPSDEPSTASGDISQVNASLSSTASGNISQVNASQNSIASGDISQVNASIGSTVSTMCSQVNASQRVISANPYSVCGGWAPLEARVSTANRKWELGSQVGNFLCSGTVTPGHTFSDYGEYFQNLTRRAIDIGLLIALEGDRVRPARKGEDFIGIVSGTAAIRLGDSPFCWQGRYLVDEWGRPIYEVIKDSAWEPKKVPDKDWKPKEGETEEDRPMIAVETEDDRPMIRVQKENPVYDPNKEQLPRSERPEEWTLVGLLGQVYVRCDNTIKPGDFVQAGENGIGTKSDKKTRLRAMRVTKKFDGTYSIVYCLLI